MKEIYIQERMLDEEDGKKGIWVDGEFCPIQEFTWVTSTDKKTFPDKKAESAIQKVEKEVEEYIGDGIRGILHPLKAKISPHKEVIVTTSVIRLPLNVEVIFSVSKSKLEDNDILKDYPIAVQFTPDDGDEYWTAWLPDFGFSACSCPGNTPQEALMGLGKVATAVVAYYNRKGIPLPRITPFPGNPDLVRLPSGEMLDLNTIDSFEVEEVDKKKANLCLYAEGCMVHNEEVPTRILANLMPRLEEIWHR